jgi:hypothetical protein
MPAPAKATSPSLDTVFNELRLILSRNAAGFAVREGMVKNKRDYHLVLEKPVVIDGKPRAEVYFASIIQQKGSVGFYFSPQYCEDAPELLRHLDGKSCFHLKSVTPELKREINGGLKAGRKVFRERKWL